MPDARVINTSSGAGLQGSVGQASYSAAKAGIAGLTLVAAQELARYGVTVNAIAPSARTRMTEGAFAEAMAAPESGFDAMDPANVSPDRRLARQRRGSAASPAVSSRSRVARICVEEGWNHGPARDAGARWDAAEVGAAIEQLLAEGRRARGGVRRMSSADGTGQGRLASASAPSATPRRTPSSTRSPSARPRATSTSSSRTGCGCCPPSA